MIDKEELAQLYAEAYELAKELCPPEITGYTEEHDVPIYKENPLFKTTFQCIFWEGCHYVYGRKLKELKVK